MRKIDQADLNKLYKAILSLQSMEECAAFFEDACTIQEIEAIAQRFEVAVHLSEGKSYVDVNKNTGASTATICRVSKCLNYGNGGYKTVIERISKGDKDV